MDNLHVTNYLNNLNVRFVRSVPDGSEWASISSDPYKSRRVQLSDDLLYQSLSKIFLQDKQHKSFSIGHTKKLLRSSNRKALIELILQHEPALRRLFPEDNKLSLLWIAVLRAYQKTAELLVRLGADVNERFGIRGTNLFANEKTTILHNLPFMYPSSWNQRFFALILEHGGDVKAKDTFGYTPLHIATWRGRVQETKLLLEKRAEVNARSIKGVTPLHMACRSNEAGQLLPLLMERGADYTARTQIGLNVLHCLTFALDVEHVDLVRSMIEKGVSLYERERSSYYQPIHYAALAGWSKLVQLFLDYGADVNSRVVGGKFPLYFAAERGRAEALLTLLKAGADLKLKTSRGRTALHGACTRWHGNVETIDILLSVGADMCAEDSDGNTPLALIFIDGVEHISVRLVLKALALRKARLDPSVELKEERRIKAFPKQWNYYQDCHAHLLRAKYTRIINTCTFFDLLAKCHCEIVPFMRHRDFQDNFKLYDLHGFSMYADDILGAFKCARVLYRSMLEKESVINEATYDGLGIVLPWHIVRKIVHHVFRNC